MNNAFLGIVNIKSRTQSYTEEFRIAMEMETHKQRIVTSWQLHNGAWSTSQANYNSSKQSN